MNLIDMHCDTIWKLMETNGTTLNDNPFCIDLQKLKRAESTAQFFACFIYLKQFEGNGRYTKGYDYAMQMLARIKQEIVQNKDAIAIARNFLEFDKNQAQRKLSAFVTIEEGGILDSQVNRLHTLYQEGVRLVTLLWNEENCIGSPNSNIFFIFYRKKVTVLYSHLISSTKAVQTINKDTNELQKQYHNDLTQQKNTEQ